MANGEDSMVLHQLRASCALQPACLELPALSPLTEGHRTKGLSKGTLETPTVRQCWGPPQWEVRGICSQSRTSAPRAEHLQDMSSVTPTCSLMRQKLHCDTQCPCHGPEWAARPEFSNLQLPSPRGMARCTSGCLVPFPGPSSSSPGGPFFSPSSACSQQSGQAVYQYKYLSCLST